MPNLNPRLEPQQKERLFCLTHNPVIVALDGNFLDDMVPTLERLRDTSTILKVGDLVVSMGVDRLIPSLHEYGLVFVDLKTHDTPATVFNTCKRIAIHNPWACTIHASGGTEMAEAALSAFSGTDTLILAVTVLTSLDTHNCEEIYTRLPIEQVEKLADMMWSIGIRGFVCSPLEVSMLREKFPEATLVTPGVRSTGKNLGLQARVTTPKEALDRGADYVVMGSQLFETENPVTELLRVMKEELGITTK